MKIALVSQCVSPGLLIFRKDLIQSLVKQGHTVYAFALDYDDVSLKRISALGAIPVKYSLSRAGMNPIKDIKDTFLLYKQFCDLGLDTVLSFFVKPSIYGTIAAFLAGVPKRFAMIEGLGYAHTKDKNGFSFKKRFLQIALGCLYTISLPLTKKVIFLNHDDPRDLAKSSLLSKNKAFILGGIGVDIEYNAASKIRNEDSPVSFLFVGRLLKEKGIFEFLEAARKIKTAIPSSKFTVLGAFDLENPSGIKPEVLNEYIEKGIVSYPGHVSNVLDFVRTSDVFVLPSYREGIPRSTQEAMAMGKPVVTTDVPGCRDTVLDGSNGFIVPAWDVDALAQKMIQFIENPQLISKMGQKSFEFAQANYDVHKVNKKLIQLITD
ncbi:glycosyltransferase family 1 protein [Parashewanella curva]|uniref:Glycosyltransferase family 1 protein n=1 Tax=Parashewanella curva TaxID=2338552 RepID=A0A3L8Q157_9GAMM|nr:glycosyltransferase family 4 protein [Parashewanella curva]RLV61407.1 glycosyltransferase family 1 protein [Parashewanella curva]